VIRIAEQTPRRLILSSAPPLAMRVAAFLLMLFGSVFSVGLAPTLGVFGWLFAVFWVGLSAFMLRELSWTKATFDADQGTLELREYRLPGWFRRDVIDATNLEAPSPDQIEIWSRLVGDGMQIEEVQRTLRIRRSSGRIPDAGGVADAIKDMTDNLKGQAPDA